MKKSLLFILISVFINLMLPKTALAAWNGLSTAGPDYLSSTDGKTWTYEIGNDGTVYVGGEQVKLAFAAYWCGKNGAAGCAGDNTDYKGVSTLQNFTISAPVAGDSTAAATKTFTISSTDYPCGRVQVDLVPDPNPNSDILGGHIYDTNKICPPGFPTNLSASCPTPGTSAALSWASDTLGLASYYPLRVDYNPASFHYNDSCTSTGNNTGDICNITYAATSNTFSSIAGGSYHWSVEACNSSGCSGQLAANFVCAPPAPTNLSALCSSGTGTFNWISGSGATADDLRVDYNPVSWSNNCKALNSNDYCFDPASPGTIINMTAGTYAWWVDSCNGGGCTTRSGSNFICTSTTQNPLLSADDCTSTPTPGQINNPVTWSVSNVFGGTGTFTYTWSGDDGLTSTTSNTTSRSNSVNKTYTDIGTGTKKASVTISSGTSTPISKSCSITITAPDLQVETLSSVTAEVNNAVGISATVKNYGDGTTGVSSTTRLQIDTNKDNNYTDTTDISSDKTTGILSAGGSATHTWSAVWTPTAAGTYNYQVCADATKAVTESDENNNCQASTIIVTAAATTLPGAFDLKPPTTACSSDGFPYVDLVWDASSGATSYEVFQGTSNLTPSKIYQLIYRDTGLTLNTKYTYQIQAGNSKGTTKSDAESITTLSSCSTSTPTPTPTPVPASSDNAWIQTINGDVHSDTGIIVGP